ncbi:hypothetical protein [Psychrobacter vallis]|uniref:hypothetical protein n=1 Tax=Psychrobacter vallis TaxID=248451 RepID=UPI00191AC730|nr:hypothetical protein [Psychrobacter vallis]
MINCQYCKNSKPTDDFYQSSIRKDGKNGSCKECVRAKVRANRAKNIDHYLEFDRKRANNPDRVQARKDYQLTERGQQKASAAKRAYAERNPLIRQAHNAVNNALRDGKLARASCCETCQSEAELHGHHCDYNKPLDVMWLCDPCHKAWHKDNTPIYCDELKLA